MDNKKYLWLLAFLAWIVSVAFAFLGVPKAPFIFSVIGAVSILLYFALVLIDILGSDKSNKDASRYFVCVLAIGIVIVSVIIANPQTTSSGTWDVFDFVPFLPHLLN